MSFKEVEHIGVGGPKLHNSVKLHRTKNGPATLRFSVDVLQKLGADKFVKVLYGSDEHVGMLLIQASYSKGKSVYTLIGKDGSSKRCAVNARTIGLISEFKVSAPDFKFNRDGLIVTIPPHLLKSNQK